MVILNKYQNGEENSLIERIAYAARVDGSIRTIEFWENAVLSPFIHRDSLLERLSLIFPILDSHFPNNWDRGWDIVEGGLLPSLIIYFPEVTITNDDGKGLSVENAQSANEAITAFDAALNAVSSQRANLGAVQNRLEYTISNLDNTAENLTSAESTLRDVDMAKEMMEFSKNNILNQAAQAMISEANQQPQNVLQLLR